MYLTFTHPIRKGVGPDDLLVYADDEYLVFRKEGSATGSLDSALHLTQIGLEGLGNVRVLFP